MQETLLIASRNRKMTATACLFDSSIEGCQIVRFSTAVKETAKLGESKVKHPATTVSKWNTQNPACVFHFIHEAKKSEGMSLEVTSIGFVGTNPKSTPLPGVDYFKNQEVYEEKRHKASIEIEPKRERQN